MGVVSFKGGLFVKQPIYVTGLYYRLSRDDDGDGESNSINTQRMMLRRYAEENGLRVVDEYIEKSVIVGIKSRRLLGHKALLV